MRADQDARTWDASPPVEGTPTPVAAAAVATTETVHRGPQPTPDDGSGDGGLVYEAEPVKSWWHSPRSNRWAMWALFCVACVGWAHALQRLKRR